MNNKQLYDFVALHSTKHAWTHASCYSYEESVKMAQVYKELREREFIKICNSIPEIHEAIKADVAKMLFRLAL